MALVLVIKEGEKFFIGDSEVFVDRVHKGRVVVSVTAPKDVPVDREKVRRLKDASRMHATSDSGTADGLATAADGA